MAHVTLVDNKPYDLLSASRNPKKASDWVQFYSKPEKSKSNAINSNLRKKDFATCVAKWRILLFCIFLFY